MTLTYERLREVLSYNKQSGLFRWRETRNHLSKKGSVAGCESKDSGYTVIRIDGVLYRANRLAVFYVTGEWPLGEVDHRDLDRSNDRWRNLRDATPTQNAGNRRAQSNNALGIKGVDLWTGSRGQTYYRVQIKCDGVRKTTYFKTEEEAVAAYAKQADALFGEFARVA